jgi:murein DD-endopeptidase MepM/ murein hydrolase activator NlpD
MRNIGHYLPFLLLTAVHFACSTSKKGLFSKKTAHEQYADQLSGAGLNSTALGSLWLAAAEKALVRPLTITLPYRESGYFAADKPDAAGYSFAARRGEQVHIQVSVKPAGRFLLFADLWQGADAGNKPSLLAAADTVSWQLRHEVERDGRLVLRLQPELLRGGEYTVVITTAPSLAFPVPARSYQRIGSFWGDARDAGNRKHEGIDIFGKRRTPVVAAADGIVSSTRENNLGGKVVFMRPDGKDYTLYYAHLDSQLVSEGQRVARGDVLGLMGNTGNARNTPTHLHFGIYTMGGAVDPMPFVNPDRPAPRDVSASLELLHNTVRNTAAATLRSSADRSGTVAEKLPANQVMQVLAATGNWYKVALPDSREGFIESGLVSGKPYRSQALKNAAPLLDTPDTVTAVKDTIPAGSSISIMGSFGDYHYVRYQAVEGWLRQQ